MKKVLSSLLALLLVLSLSACQNAPTQAGGEAASIELTDSLGRTVVLEHPAERIASSYYISTSLLVALEAKDKLVGVEAKAGQKALYQKAAPNLLELPEIGSGKGLNVEECARIQPDLVIIPVRLQDSIPKLEQLGIPVVAISPETYDDFLATVELIGKAIGKDQRAAQLISYYQDNVRDISERVKNVSDKPKVYIAGGGNPLTTCTANMYQHTLIETCGGQNVTANLTDAYWTTISAEQLQAVNPDFIFRVNYASYSNEDIMKDPQLAALSAVKNQKVYTFPSTIEPWDYPTPTSILGVLWLTNQIHPDLYTTEEFRRDAHEFYKTFFGLDVSDADIGL